MGSGQLSIKYTLVKKQQMGFQVLKHDYSNLNLDSKYEIWMEGLREAPAFPEKKSS